jgi:hypothetical protein
MNKLATFYEIGGSHFNCSSQGRATPAPMKKLPDNPTDRHPVMLLNQLRPAATFEDAGQQGVPPNMMFTVSVNVDGASYQGIGKIMRVVLFQLKSHLFHLLQVRTRRRLKRRPPNKLWPLFLMFIMTTEQSQLRNLLIIL